MRNAAVVLSLMSAVAFPGWLSAHEGHAHKVMGTVAAMDATHIEVDATDGKKLSILVTSETKYLKGKAPAVAGDVKVGQRVVVTFAEDGGKRTAREVLLGTGGQSPPAKPKP